MSLILSWLLRLVTVSEPLADYGGYPPPEGPPK